MMHESSRAKAIVRGAMAFSIITIVMGAQTVNIVHRSDRVNVQESSSVTQSMAYPPGSVTFHSVGNLSLRFYNSTAPANGKISGLQKGAILLDHDAETVGEGAGFGVPVLDWAGRTYYSTTARTAVFKGGVSRTYSLDAIEEGPAYHTSFVSAVPAGEVRVMYRVEGQVLSVEADLTGLPLNSTLMMLNEQAGTVYTRFTDFDSCDTIVDFSWKKVTGWYNYLLDGSGNGFRVDYTPGFYGGATLHLGRETSPEGFDWAGLDYTVDLPVWGRDRFEYQIHLVEAG